MKKIRLSVLKGPLVTGLLLLMLASLLVTSCQNIIYEDDLTQHFKNQYLHLPKSVGTNKSIIENSLSSKMINNNDVITLHVSFQEISALAKEIAVLQNKSRIINKDLDNVLETNQFFISYLENTFQTDLPYVEIDRNAHHYNLTDKDLETFSKMQEVMNEYVAIFDKNASKSELLRYDDTDFTEVKKIIWNVFEQFNKIDFK